MELFGRQQHLYYLNQELSDKMQTWVWQMLSATRTGAAALELAREVLGLADRLIEEFETGNRLPRQLACGPGCTPCCFNQVEVTVPEALLIGDYLEENFSAPQREELRRQVSAAAASKAGKSKQQIARIRGSLPCLLLYQDRCSVYEVRPLVCRAMHAFDAAACRRELADGKLGPEEFYGHRYEVVWSVSAGVQNGCKLAEVQTGVFDLDVALSTILTRRKPAADWVLGGKVLPER